MGLGDKEKSGTPQETQGAAAGLGNILQAFFTNPAGNQGLPFQRNRTEALTSLLGFDPAELDIEGSIRSAIADPGDVTSDLFSALEPFEARETDRQITGLREMFGTLGGRFGRNVGQAEGTARAELAEGFARNRAQQTIPAMLQAQGQRNNALFSLLGAIQGGDQNNLQSLGQFIQFLNPGAPFIQEGLGGKLLSAGGAAAGAFA